MVVWLSLVACDLGVPADQLPDDGSWNVTNTSSGGGSTDHTGEEVIVDMRGLAFHDHDTTITVGTTVTWVNQDTAFHIVVQGEPGNPDPAWESGPIQFGESWSWTFTEPGDVIYYCENHERVMKDAMIRVVE